MSEPDEAWIVLLGCRILTSHVEFRGQEWRSLWIEALRGRRRTVDLDRRNEGSAMRETLGRLLGSRDSGEESSVVQIDVDEVVSNPYQPRTVFDEESIAELARTIQTHGIIQPVVVRRKDGHFELIAGERRWRAAKSLGWRTLPAIVRSMNDAQAASAALIENLQREGLTPIEEAVAYQQLLELHGLTQENLAQRLGKGQSTIANKLRLLNLPTRVQEALLRRQITERHARALLAVPLEGEQVHLLEECIARGWNVKQMEGRVKTLLEQGQTVRNVKGKRRGLSKDVRLAVNTVRESLHMIEESGLLVQWEESDENDFYEFVIRVSKPKSLEVEKNVLPAIALQVQKGSS